MDFQEMIKLVIANVRRYEKKHGLKFDSNLAALKLTEELGEYMQALIIHQNNCRPEKFLSEEKAHQDLSEELGDVLGIVILNAHIHGIDLEEALDKKWMSKVRKQTEKQ